jgi:hypothetical protein
MFFPTERRYRKVIIDLTWSVDRVLAELEELGHTSTFTDVVETVVDLVELFLSACTKEATFGGYDTRAAELIVSRIVPDNPTDRWVVRRHRHQVVSAVHQFYSRSLKRTEFRLIDDYAIHYPRLQLGGYCN